MHSHNKQLLKQFVRGISLIMLILPLWLNAAEVVSENPFEKALSALKTDDFEKKEVALRQLAEIQDPRVLEVIKAIQDARLYYDANGIFINYDETTDPPSGTNVLTGEKLTDVDAGKYEVVSINNQLRSVLDELKAGLNLQNPDSKIRLAAVNELVGQTSPDKQILFKKILAKETNAEIIDALEVAIALADLENTDQQIQIKAVQRLRISLRPEVYNQLKALQSNLATKTDMLDLQSAVRDAMNYIDSQREKYQVIKTTFYGLSLGSILLLVAIGLAITFGVMGVINMAHGEMMMLGAYTTYMIQTAFPSMLEYSILIAIPAAFLVSGLAGIAIERSVIRFLYNRPLETLLATFGISLILQQLVRTFISAQNVVVKNPQWLSGSWVINPVLEFTYNSVFIFIFSMGLFIALLLILKKTSLGLQVRAVSQNRAMAKAMGVRTEWVDALTFGLGSGIAGIAGVALSQITNVGPNLGQGYIIDSFMVVVFGGVGNIWGTLVGSLSMGVVNKYMEPWTGAVLAKILVLIFIILFIQKRPRGLFPQKGRAAEN